MKGCCIISNSPGSAFHLELLIEAKIMIMYSVSSSSSSNNTQIYNHTHVKSPGQAYKVGIVRFTNQKSNLQ